MKRSLMSLLTVVACLGFLLFVTPASAQSQGCPGGAPWIGSCAAIGEFTPDPTGCIADRRGCDYNGNGSCDDGQYFVYRTEGTECTTTAQEDGLCDDWGTCIPIPPLNDPSTCEGDEVVLDLATGLCWTKSFVMSTTGIGPGTDACNALSNGYDDWGMPDIDQLRSLVEGCPATTLGGACQVTDPDCLANGTCSANCGGCGYVGGSHYGASFLDQAGAGALTLSKSEVSDEPGNNWVITFNDAAVRSLASGSIRCVRTPETGGSGGPQQDIISDSTAPDSFNHHVFDVEPGSPFSVTFETHSGAAFYFVEWDQPGGFGGNQCYKHVTAGQTDSCANLTVDAAATQAYVTVNGLQYGVDYTITVDYISSGSGACADADGDTVCDADDVCPGYDDTLDADGDGTPDGCDSCPFHVDSVTGNSGAEYCGSCPFDVVGTTQSSPYSFTPDGRVTYGMDSWLDDDVMACYYTYLTPVYMQYFPGCDLNGNGLVDVDEVLDIYNFVEPYSTGGNPAYLYLCP